MTTLTSPDAPAPTRRKTSRKPVLAVLLGIAVLFGFSLALPGSVEWRLVGLFSILTVVVLYLTMVNDRIDWPNSPVFLILLILSISTIGRYLYFSYFPDAAVGRWYMRNISELYFTYGAALVFLFVCVFCVIYLLITHGVKPAKVAAAETDTTRPEPSPQLLNIVGLSLIAVSAVFFILYAAAITGDITAAFSGGSRKRALFEGGTRIALGQFLYFTKCIWASVLIGYYLLTVRKHRGILSYVNFWGGFAVMTYIAYWTNIRGELALLVVAIGLLQMRWQGKVLSGTFAVLLVAGFLSFAVTSVARVQGDTAPPSYFSERPIAQMEGAQLVADRILGAINLGGFVATGHAVRVVPERLDYTYGSTLVAFLWTPIPRSIWPDKPLALGYRWLAAFQSEFVLRQRVGGGNSAGIVSEGYLSGGVLGVIGVAALMAVLLGSATRYALLRARSSYRQIYFITFTTTLVYVSMGYDFSQGILDLAFRILPMVVAIGVFRILLSSGRKPQSSARTA